MRILVTGAAGFIGSHLSDRFHNAGHTVFGVDNFETGLEANVGGWAFTPADVASPVFLEIAAEFKPEVIVHCAASYADREKWHRDTRTNVEGSVNVAIAARTHGARVTFFQTALVYGGNPYSPAWSDGEMPRIAPGPLPVFTPTNPENSYAISKYAGGQYLRHSGVPLLELRLANIYGPRNLSGPVPTFYKRVTETKPCTITDTRRDFIYIQDLVDLVAQAVSMEAAGTYHVSTGRDYPIGQVYDAVVGALDAYDTPEPQHVGRGPDDAPTILLDPSETQRDFSWVATTDLDEGVEQAVAWYRQHGVAETYTHLAGSK